MSASSVLCSICNNIIRSHLFDASPRRNFFKPHHLSQESLLEALRRECFICSTFWSNAAPEARSWWGECSTENKQTEFRCYTEKHVDGLVKLEVAFSGCSALSLGRSETKFRVVCVRDSVHFVTSDYRKSHSHTSSSETLDLALTWLKECGQMHGDCNFVSDRLSNWWPTRLIYIGGNDDNIWKLCTRTTDMSTVGSEPYMTLSYRWGTPKFLLRSENINLFMQGLPIDDLPKTFRDAVLVAKHFSVKYIWIDALCIIQDSLSDWAAEAPNMQYVYGNSICNIAACASTDQDSGFFSTQDTGSIFPCIVDIPASDGPVAKTQKRYAIYEKDYWCRQLQSGSIHSRGWIFQECLLAPRVLYFTKDQILWECLTITRSEGFPTGIPYNVSSNALDALWDELSHRESDSAEMQMSSPTLHSRRINELWKRLVEKYSECDLSVASDKLPAFEGIARLFREVTQDEYAAGLWQSCLVDQLNWFVLEPKKLKQPSRGTATWSWASIDGPVKYMKSTSSENSLISEGSNTIGSDHLIGIDHSTKHAIHLTGMIHACTVRYENETIECHVAGHTFDGTCYLDHLDLDLERDARDIFFMPVQSFSFCTVPADDEESHQIAGLMLRAMRSPSRGTFQRIGYFITSSAADVSSMGIDPTTGRADEQYDTRRATTSKII